jgi:hypothetical protein
MRINVNVSDLTSAQFSWLLRNVEGPWEIAEGATRVCVVFEHSEKIGGISGAGSAMHRELPVRAWIGIVEHLKTITHTAQALLTPDALPGGES